MEIMTQEKIDKMTPDQKARMAAENLVRAGNDWLTTIAGLKLDYPHTTEKQRENLIEAAFGKMNKEAEKRVQPKVKLASTAFKHDKPDCAYDEIIEITLDGKTWTQCTGCQKTFFWEG